MSTSFDFDKEQEKRHCWTIVDRNIGKLITLEDSDSVKDALRNLNKNINMIRCALTEREIGNPIA